MAPDAPDESVDLCKMAAGPVPGDAESNFDNPTTLAPTMLAVMSILVAWAILFTGARFYVNIRKLQLADCKCTWLSGLRSFNAHSLRLQC